MLTWSGKYLSWFVALAALISPLSRPAAAEKITAGVYLRVGNSQDAQFKALFSETLRYLQGKLGISITPLFYTDSKAFDRALAKQGLDLVWQIRDFDAIQGYEPFLTYTIYGEAGSRYCLYVHQNNTAKNFQALRGGTLMLPPKKLNYYLLRDHFGEKPEDFFRTVYGSVSIFSGFYALSLGQVDALYATKIEYLHLKQTNPGAVKQVKILTCDKLAKPFSPVLVRQALPSGLKNKIGGFFLTLHQDTTFKGKALLHLTKTKFLKVSKDYLDPYGQLHQKGMKLGWDKDFEIFQTLVQVKGG